MVKINFVGDVAIFREFENRNIDPFKSIKLPESSFNIANLEFPLPDNITKKYYYDVDDNYRISDEFSRKLDLGLFHLYSLANNHIQDYGADGIKQTIDKVHDSGSSIFGVGVSQFNPFSCKIEDINFLFIGFVKRGRWNRKEGCIGPDPYDMERLISLISSSKTKYDHIILFPHWGTELVDAPDPSDVENARKMIDAGASCVIGHHPHVSQGCEIYKEGIIAYSLGSFIYLPDFEKGNSDNSPDRDVSICLNITFDKSSILSYTPYRYTLNRDLLTPDCTGDFRSNEQYNRLCSAIGNRSYYSKRVRSILLRRELASFISRFKDSPLYATTHYFGYIKPKHIKKIIGMR